MPERSLGLAWVETLPPPQGNQFIFIRHGESEYTGMGLDLTGGGINQAHDTAREMKQYLGHFDRVKVITSPAARAHSTALFFVQHAGIVPDEFIKERLLRHVDIKDLKGFVDYQQAHSTDRYGELWLTDKFLARDNNLAESRVSVENRARDFLFKYSKAVENYSKENGKTGILVFTHFEIIMYYLKSTYPNRDFPIRSRDGVQNAEPVIVQIDDTNRKLYTVVSRGVSSPAKV